MLTSQKVIALLSSWEQLENEGAGKFHWDQGKLFKMVECGLPKVFFTQEMFAPVYLRSKTGFDCRLPETTLTSIFCSGTREMSMSCALELEGRAGSARACTDNFSCFVHAPSSCRVLPWTCRPCVECVKMEVRCCRKTRRPKSRTVCPWRRIRIVTRREFF